ncbi:MAG: hypothetical protein R3B07_14160 [Polyangiaceae bacterium]
MARVPLLVSLLSLVVLAPACSLVVGDIPEAAKSDASGGTAGVGGSAGAAGAAGAAGSAAVGGIGGEGAAGGAGAGAGGTTGGSAGGSGGGGVPGCVQACDCDDDGQQATSCGGDDCDDNDKLVFKGQTEYFTEASTNPKVLFDFNCSGQIERDPDLDHEVNCGLLALTGCSGQGFSVTAPTCGTEADWGECRSNGITCKHVALSKRVMACH